MTNTVSEIITLKQLCAEMKLDPRATRERLREAVREGKQYPELAKSHRSRGAWQWVKGSVAHGEARQLLASTDTTKPKPGASGAR